MSKGPEDKQQLAFRAALDKLLQDPTNKICSECRAAGVFFCMKCSGIHRSLGTHISFVRSVTLDKWKENEVENMHPGNSRGTAIYEATLPPNFIRPSSDQIALTTFIRNKYVNLRYVDPNFDPNNPRAFQPPQRQEASPPPVVEQPKLVVPPVQQQNVSPVRRQPEIRTPVVLTPNIFDEPDPVPPPAPVVQQPSGPILVSLFQVDAPAPPPLASQQDVAKNNILNLLSQEAPPQSQGNYMPFGYPQNSSPQAFPYPMVSGQQVPYEQQTGFLPPQQNWGQYPESVDSGLELLNKIQSMAQEKRAGTGISEIYF